MTRAQRKAVLELVTAGYDVQAAAAKLDISMSDVRKAGKTFDEEIADAFATATSRLRGKLLESALADNDTRAIAVLLDKREAAQAASGAGTITRIERVIIDEKLCPKCGYDHSPRSNRNGARQTVKLSDLRGPPAEASEQ